MKYSLVFAIASALFLVRPASAEMACYINMSDDLTGQPVDLTGLCDGSQPQSDIAFREFQPSLMVYGMQNAAVWEDNRWQRSNQVSMRVVNSGQAAANNVTLVIRGERLSETGTVEQTEFRTVTIAEVPGRVAGDLAVEFSFVPDRCAVTSMEWN